MNSIFEIRMADQKDCEYIADNLSSCDALEISAVRCGDMRTALLECYLKSSRVWSVCLVGDAQPAFVFGVARDDWRWMNAWAFSTPVVSAYSLSFCKGSLAVAGRLFDEYPNIRGAVDCRHEKSIRWLRFMGFKFDRPVEYGMHGELFFPFYHSRTGR